MPRVGRIAAVVAATLLAADPAVALDWRHVTQTANGTDVAIERESIELKDGWARVWVRHDYSRVASEKARYLVLLQDYNCNARELRIVRFAFYAPDRSILSKGEEPGDYAPAKPGSINERVGRVVCAMGAAAPGH